MVKTYSNIAKTICGNVIKSCIFIDIILGTRMANTEPLKILRPNMCQLQKHISKCIVSTHTYEGPITHIYELYIKRILYIEHMLYINYRTLSGYMSILLKNLL